MAGSDRALCRLGGLCARLVGIRVKRARILLANSGLVMTGAAPVPGLYRRLLPDSVALHVMDCPCRRSSGSSINAGMDRFWGKKIADSLTWLPEHPVEFSLMAGGHLSFSAAQAVEIRCIAGSLWITREGDLRDHLIDTGQTVWIEPPGKTVIGAARKNSDSRFFVTPLARPTRPGKFRLHFLPRVAVPYY